MLLAYVDLNRPCLVPPEIFFLLELELELFFVEYVGRVSLARRHVYDSELHVGVCNMLVHTSAHVSIRQHTSAYVSM
jgi:hypothetical protein